MSHLNWTVLFVIVAVIASFLGFTEVSETSAWVAGVFLIAFLLVVFRTWYQSHDGGDHMKRRC